ncbi:MAG: hypothetical protein ACYTET_06435 [Planctomycetota bacterium]|jgi:hypothetical protein
MKSLADNSFAAKPKGFALLVTLIVLVVLASLMTGLSIQLTMANRRQEYMIEYQRSRYGLDSAIKYILSDLKDQKFVVESREGKPDFSDIFYYDSQDYAAYIAGWAETATDEQLDAAMKAGAGMKEIEQVSIADMVSNIQGLFGTGDSNEPAAASTPTNDLDAMDDPMAMSDDEDFYLYELDPNDIEVPGPYGVDWPYVIEPIELEMGPCEIMITIEDENAKMPLSWMVTNLKETNQQASASLEIFCEWMGIDRTDMEDIQTQMEEIYAKKVFTVNPSPIILKKTTSTRSSNFKSTRARSSRRKTTRQPTSTTKTVTKTRPASAHRTDFAKLFHSSLLDQGILNAPRVQAGERIETAKKYLGLWGSQRVNVNTAPRHVLEAAFMLATTWDEARMLADEVIQKRMVEPIKNVKDIQEIGMLDTETYNNLKNYISTTSTFFMVRVTSRSGNASASAVVTVIKEGKQVQKLAILYD